MGFHDMLPELLLLVADNLSLEDLSSFCSTCYWVCNVLTPHFQKLYLKDSGQLTTLQWAAIRGHAKLIKLAILNGADIDVPLIGPLPIAALGVRGKHYKDDHRHPCDLASKYSTLYLAGNATRRTPLFLPACCGHADAIEILLDHCASTRYLGGIKTPTHIAASNGNVACMQAFVCPGCDINATGFEERTILHFAIYGGVEMMKYILQLDGGKNLVNAKTRKGIRPLHTVAMSIVDRDCQRLETELLLQYGANIYAWDNVGYTPAHYFASWGKFDYLQVLIDAGFDLQTRAECGKTILHWAIHGGEKMMLDLLELEAGRSIIDVEDNYGSIALDYAMIYHTEKIENVLPHHNARRSARKKTV